jgi:hypothetical protein
MEVILPLRMLEKVDRDLWILFWFDLILGFKLITECFRVGNDFIDVSIMILRCFYVSILKYWGMREKLDEKEKGERKYLVDDKKN